MNLIDIGIIVILAISTLIGLLTGLIKAVLSLIGIVVGIVLAGRFAVPLAHYFTFIPSQEAAEIVAFALILLGVMVIATLLAWALKWITSAVMLGWVNYLGGAILGLLFGAIFCGAFLAIGVKFLDISSAVAQSSLATMLLERFFGALSLIPDKFGIIRSFFQ